MTFFRDKRCSVPSGERTSAPPPSGGVSHIAELAAQAAARNAEALVKSTPAQLPSVAVGKLQSAVRIEARRRAVPLIRQALLGSLSLEELGCVVDAQPQHVGLALSESDPSKPFAAEHFLLVAERRPMLGAEIVKAYVTLLSADLIEALADDLRALARAKRQTPRNTGVDHG